MPSRNRKCARTEATVWRVDSRFGKIKTKTPGARLIVSPARCRYSEDVRELFSISANQQRRSKEVSPPPVLSVYSGSWNILFTTAGQPVTPRHPSPHRRHRKTNPPERPGSLLRTAERRTAGTSNLHSSRVKVMRDKHALHSCLLFSKKKLWIFATARRGER